MAQMSALIAFSPDTTILSADTNSNNTTIRNTYNTHDTATTAVHGMGASTIVGTALTQTLTNKTITAPAISSPTITGNVVVNSGGDILVYSDVATTLKFSVDGSTGNTSVGDLAVAGSAVITGNCDVQNGNDFRAYSDAGSTLKFSVDGATGLTSIIGGAGGGASTDAGTLLKIEKNGTAYLEFETGAADTAGFLFSDASSGVGQLTYSHSVDQFIMNQTLSIGAAKKLYFDGSPSGGNTYIWEASADTVQIVAGGSISARFTAGDVNTDSLTTNAITLSATTATGGDFSPFTVTLNNSGAGATNGISFASTIGNFYSFKFGNGLVSTSGPGAYYGRIPVNNNGTLKYMHLFDA